MVTNCITPANGGHQLMKQAGPTSFTKIRAKLPRPPNQTPSTTWLHLEILSKKIRAGDEGQPGGV